MPDPLIRRPYGFRASSMTGRSSGTLAPSCGGVLAPNPLAYRAKSTARRAALPCGANAGGSAPGEPDESGTDSPDCRELLVRQDRLQNALAVAYAPDAELPGFAQD